MKTKRKPSVGMRCPQSPPKRLGVSAQSHSSVDSGQTRAKPVDASPYPGIAGAQGAPTEVNAGAENSAPTLRAHVGRRTARVISGDVSKAGACTIDTLVDDSGSARLVTIHVPGRSTHVLDLRTTKVDSAVGAVLSGADVAGFDVPLVTGLGVSGDQVWDAHLAARILFAGEIEAASGLVEVATRLGLDAPKVDVVSAYPTSDEITFAAEQARFITRVVDRLRCEVDRGGLSHTVSLEMEVRPVLTKMTRAGVLVDQQAFEELCDNQIKGEAKQREAASNLLGVTDLRDSRQVEAALRARGLEVVSTKSDDLAALLDSPGVADLIAWRSTAAFCDDTAKNISAALTRGSDGRVRPVWDQLGASTGRITSRQPNIIGIPRTCRSVFVPAPGNVFVEADIGASHVRILAELTGDQALINLFKLGLDPHQVTAESFSLGGSTPDRQKAKAINFGLPLKMGTPTFVAYARAEFGITITADEADELRDRYRAKHPGVAAWQDRIAAELPRVVRSPGGRARRYPPGSRELPSRLAAQLQMTEADAIKQAMVSLSMVLPEHGAQMVIVAYDSLVVECPEGEADDVKALVQSHIEAGLRRYLRVVPVVVKADVRRTWGG